MESTKQNSSFEPTPVIIDKENMRIDRNCDAGKAFEKLQEQANSLAGSGEGQFINQVLAYAEASFVVMNTMPADQAAKTLMQLKEKFESSCETKTK